MFKRVLIATILALSFVANHANAVVMDIGAMTNPHVVLNFDSMAAGATTVGAINTAFPGAGITSISFGGTGLTGTYNVVTGGGRALATDQAGTGLTLVNVGGSFFDYTSVTITLDHLITQFGLAIGDRNGTTPGLSLFAGAALVGSHILPIGDGFSDFIDSTVAFDRIGQRTRDPHGSCRLRRGAGGSGPNFARARSRSWIHSRTGQPTPKGLSPDRACVRSALERHTLDH